MRGDSDFGPGRGEICQIIRLPIARQALKGLTRQASLVRSSKFQVRAVEFQMAQMYGVLGIGQFISVRIDRDALGQHS